MLVARKAVKVSRSTVRAHRQQFPSFDQAVLDAIDDGYDYLRAKGWKRAEEHSDTLAQFFLRKDDQGGGRGLNVNLDIDVKTLSDEQLARLAAGEDPMEVVLKPKLAGGDP